MCVALNDTSPGLICHNAERRKTVYLQHCRYWTTGQRLRGAGAVNLTPVDTDLSQNTRVSDHHIVPSGYMNDRSGSIVFRCHSQKKNTSAPNHHTTSDSRGFSQKRNKNITSDKLRVQELSSIAIKQKNVLKTHIRNNRSRFGDEWLVRVERSQFKRYDNT